MGCWGITAFESDDGLDAVSCIRAQLPADGKLDLDTILEVLREDTWNAPGSPEESGSHTSPMALAEIIVKFLDGEAVELDPKSPALACEKNFADVTSFTASKAGIQWVRDYLSDTLRAHRADALNGRARAGWFKETDWVGWQSHMELLIGRLDAVMQTTNDQTAILWPPQGQSQEMKL